MNGRKQSYARLLLAYSCSKHVEKGLLTVLSFVRLPAPGGRGETCADLSKRDSDPKTVRSNLSISGVNLKGLRVPILTFTRGYSNGKIFSCLSVLFACPGCPDPCVTHTCGASRYHTSLREKDVRPSEHKGKPGAHTALL